MNLLAWLLVVACALGAVSGGYARGWAPARRVVVLHSSPHYSRGYSHGYSRGWSPRYSSGWSGGYGGGYGGYGGWW